MLVKYCVIYFGFLHIHERNNLELGRNCCDEFEQVNGGCLMLDVGIKLPGCINLK